MRLGADMTLRELARAAGVSVSGVAGIEKGRISVSLGTLRKLLVALESDLGPFFAERLPAPEGCVFRRRQMKVVADAGRSYTLVLPPRRDIGLVLLHEELRAGERPRYEALSGDLAGLVLSGELFLEVRGDPPQTLRAGDAFYVPAGRPVRGRCAGGPAVRLVTAQLRPATSARGSARLHQTEGPTPTPRRRSTAASRRRKRC